MILFENNIAGFFIFQTLFFIAAFALGNWYSKEGLAAWGLNFSSKLFKPLFIGMLFGILVYAIPYCMSLVFGIETIIRVPGLFEIVKASLPFVFGVLFSSFAEDILTRGLIYKHFNHKIKPLFLILLSASIYLLNHIYRLTNGTETILYLFLLGIIFIIPLIQTNRLWFTGGMHWAGNSFFFVSHNVVQTESNNTWLSPNYLFAICLAVFIPVIWFLLKNYSSAFSGNSSKAKQNQ
jgi:membrane protease YdiL (CAAX protease family)